MASSDCTAMLYLSYVLALGPVFEARRTSLWVLSQLSVMDFDDLGNGEETETRLLGA